MDRMEALQKRIAELEQWQAEMERRQAAEGPGSSEKYTHRQRRLEILRHPITTHARLVPSMHCEVDVGSHGVWVEQMKLRIGSLKKAFI